MTTGVIYARVSSIGDRQSTERQVKDLSEYAKYKGIEVCKVFEEHISGAKKNDERSVLCEAMEYCKANRIGILLVNELSRLGRNAFEVLASVKELIDCVALTSTYKRNSLNYWTMKDIRPSLLL